MSRWDPYEPDDRILWPCPICGEEHPEHFLRDRLGHLLGCSECICEELPERYYEETDRRRNSRISFFL